MSVSIERVYPPTNHQTAEASTFLVGQLSGDIPDGAQLFAQYTGSELTANRLSFVVENGFFAHRVPLQMGENSIVLVLKTSTDKVLSTSLCGVTRLGPIEPLKDADPEWLWPRGDLAWEPSSGDEEPLLIRIAVAPGASWRFRLKSGDRMVSESLGHALALPEDPSLWDNRSVVFAQLHQVEPPRRAATLVEAGLKIPAMIADAPLTLEVLNVAQPQRVFRYPHRIQYWVQPVEAKVNEPEALTRTAPHDEAARLTPQPAGVRLWLNRQENGYARLAFTETPMWLRLEDIDILSFLNSFSCRQFFS